MKKEINQNYPSRVSIYDDPLRQELAVALCYEDEKYTLTLKDTERNFVVSGFNPHVNVHSNFLMNSSFYTYFQLLPQWQVEIALKGKALFTNINGKVEFCKIDQNRFNKTQIIKTTSSFEIDIYED